MRYVQFHAVSGGAVRLCQIAEMWNHPLDSCPKLLILSYLFPPYLVAVSCNRKHLGDRHLVTLITAHIYSVCRLVYGLDGPGFDYWYV